MDIGSSAACNEIRQAARRNAAGGAALLLDALCERLLRHCDVDVWRQVFLGPAYQTIRFEVVPLTLVATDDPLADISPNEGAELAARFGGHAEPSRVADLVLSFREAADALRAALVLQRLSGGRRVRTVLSTALCTVACFELEGRPCRMVVGREIEQAEAGVRLAAGGTIVVSAETYAVLGDGISEQVSDGLVTTEMEDETVTQASITLAPHASAPMSTFAGLGLL